jgi:hypothetical protein
MKTSTFYATLLAVATTLLACEKEKIITAGEQPVAVETFIETHFPGVEVTAIVREKEGLDVDYTVYMANGFEIDFTKSGDWDDVDGRTLPIPESILALLPKTLTEYVTGTFPNLWIVEVNQERYGYEIGLPNGLDLAFDSNGRFIGWDD